MTIVLHKLFSENEAVFRAKLPLNLVRQHKRHSLIKNLPPRERRFKKYRTISTNVEAPRAHRAFNFPCPPSFIFIAYPLRPEKYLKRRREIQRSADHNPEKRTMLQNSIPRWATLLIDNNSNNK